MAKRSSLRAILTILALAAFVAPPAKAEPCYSWPVERVVDGDTLHAGGLKIRLMGFDTPELRARCEAEAILAKRATERLQELAGESDVRFCPSGKDRYGRTLATMPVNGKNVADILIGEGLAREYHGGRRAGWCG